MLDDTKYIKQIDSQGALGVVLDQFKQLSHQFELSAAKGASIERVVVAGMGGSALPASFLEVWPGLKVPFFISRGYKVPEWVSEKTLVVGSSYSGNTEETLSAFEDAQKKGAQLAVISTGGRLGDWAQGDNLAWAKLPTGLPPRMAFLAALKGLVSLLEAHGLLSGAVDELERAGEKLKDVPYLWGATTPTEQNFAKQIAQHAAGKTPIMYGGLLDPAAYKWKISFNENAKNTAWSTPYSECNHNEMAGWTSHPVEKPFAVFDLLSSFDHPQIKQRFVLTDRLLSGMRPKAWQIQAEGETLLEQLLWTVALGDAASVYLAILNGANPTETDIQERLKQELSTPATRA